MPKTPARGGGKTGTWRLENADVWMDIERATGLIRSMHFKRAGQDLFRQIRGGIPGYAGTLRIFDERDDRWYDDLRTPFTVSAASKRGNVVRLTRRYRGAPFTVRVTMRMEEDGLHWEVEAAKVGRAADRSLRVHFCLPLVAGWDVWAPCRFGERTFDGMTPFEFMYVQVPYVSDQEIILPMVSHYHRGLGVGYSVVEPIDANVPAAKFVFNNGDKCFNWGTMHKDPRTVPMLEAVNYYIGLVGRRPMRTGVMVLFHEGDWRPGLGKVYRRWREYFDPWNPAIYDREGCFLCGGVQNADEVDRLVAMGLKTMEVHGHFQDYGDYFQQGRRRWHRIGVREGIYHKMVAARREVERTPLGDWVPSSVTADDVEAFLRTHTDAETAAYLGLAGPQDLYHERDDIRRRLKILSDAGIACHWYFNYTDGYRPRVERDWPDSISKDEDGRPVPSGWYMCHNMNADPRWSFGRFCHESARRIFEEYPMLAGFFMDCFRHYEIDFAHDDGVTVVNGKAAYSMNHSYDDIERLIKETVLKPRNLTSFANKPMSIRSMRYCDGQLLEGDGDIYEEKFFWASIACPIFYLWGDPNRSTDEFLRRCVLNGAWPTLVARTDANIALYQRYLPLFAQFRRRVFCFEPDPMRVPRHSRGKLYTVPDGYVAGIMAEAVDEDDRVAYGRTPYALFRVERGHDVGRVGVQYPGDGEMRDAAFKFDGTFVAVPLRDYSNCAVVRLFVTGRGRRKIGPDVFQTRARMCADPESAFEDISER